MTPATPPKHKTPNYKLVGHVDVFPDAFNRTRVRTIWTWEAQPLRASRKDLKVA